MGWTDIYELKKVQARSQLGTRFSVIFPYSSCLARNELEPSMGSNFETPKTKGKLEIDQ